MDLPSNHVRHKNRVFTLTNDQKYHLFASYCTKDKHAVREFLSALENIGLQINDPDRDFVPGEPVLRNIVERGLEISKMFIMFITKNFLSSPWCCYEADLAVWKYVTSKGKYRVIPIVLEPCNVPANIKVLNCIHIWKYKLKQKTHQSNIGRFLFSKTLKERVIKAITSPPLKFRRFRYIGMKSFNRGSNLLQKVRMETMKDRTRDETVTSNHNPFTYIKLMAVVDHCLLHCKYGHCGFSCSGRNFLQFHNHLNTCRYRPVKCSNRPCLHICQKWESVKHLNECKFSKIHCDYEGCKMTVQRGRLEAHREVCQFQPVPCPNLERGCQMRIFSKDLTNHLDSCEYVEIKCKCCESKVIRKYEEQHLNHCPLLVLECEACKTQTFRRDFSYHQDRCPNILHKCHNVGCEAILTKAQMMVHQNECQFKIHRCQNVYCGFEGNSGQIERHKTNCEYRNIKCEDCGKYIHKKNFKNHKKEHGLMSVCELCKMSFPNSAYETHKKWMCPRQKYFVSHCDICNKAVPFSDLEEHKNEHYTENKCPIIRTVDGQESAENDDDPFVSDFVSGGDTYVGNGPLSTSKIGVTNKNGIESRFFESATIPNMRKRCNSLPTDYVVESMVSLLAEPDIQASTGSRRVEDNEISNFRYKPKDYVTSRKKFNNILRAVDSNILLLKQNMRLKNYGHDKSLSYSEVRAFLNSC